MRSHSILFMTKFAKIASLSLVAFALVFTMTAKATSTKAAACTFTRSLTTNMSGADVTCLQTYLMGAGFSIPAGATGYFGGQTKAAVMAWQSANGVMPAAGYFGPISQAKYMAVAGGSTTTTPTPGCPAGAMFNSMTGAPCTGSTGSTTLEGTDGQIDNTSKISSYNNEEAGEGQDDVKVMGFEVETTTDGDIALKSMKLEFDPTTTSGSDHLDDYITGVSIWKGSTKIGSADVSDFTENNNIYTKTVTLNNVKVSADTTEKFYVTVDVVNNLDSADESGDAWSLDVVSMRYMDGSGVVDTYDSDSDSLDTGINFVDFGTAADTELKFSAASDSPDAGIVLVNESSVKDNVTLLKGKMKLDGDSDVNIDAMPITFSPTGSNMNAIVDSIKLIIDGEEYSEAVPSVSASSSASVTFDNLDFNMNAGDTVEFEVVADINGTDDYNEGDTITASFTASNRALVDVENEEGDQLNDSNEKSGTVTGEAQELRSNGVNLTLVSTNTSTTSGQGANDDLGTFTIKFKVKAMGDDIYVSSLATATTGATSGNANVFVVDRAGTATTGGVTVTLTNLTDTDLTTTGNYLVEDGSEETFEATITAQLPSVGAAGQFRAKLAALKWATTDSTGAYSTYTSNLDAFKTSYLGLN